MDWLSSIHRNVYPSGSCVTRGMGIEMSVSTLARNDTHTHRSACLECKMVRFTKNLRKRTKATVPNSEMSRLKVATKVAKLFTGKIDVTRRYSGLSVRWSTYTVCAFAFISPGPCNRDSSSRPETGAVFAVRTYPSSWPPISFLLRGKYSLSIVIFSLGWAERLVSRE